MHTTGAFGISATPGTIATPCPRPRKNPLSAQGRRRRRPAVPRETAIFAQSAQNPPPPSLAGFHVKRRPAHAATRPRSLGVAHAISPDARLATGHDGRRTAVQFGLDGRRPPVQRAGTAVGGRRCSVRARRWEDSAAAWGHGRERTALQRVGTVAGGRRCRWWRMPVAGKPEARAEGIRFVAREATRIPSPHGSGFPATGHGGRRPPLQFGHGGRRTALEFGHGGGRPPVQRGGTVVRGRRCRRWRMPVAGKPEARAEGIRCVAREATRIPSPHGSGFPATGHGGRRPPCSVRARWWETAGAACGHGREGTAVPTVADARCREARGASRGNTVRCKRSDTYSLTSRFGPPGSRA
jgi:hypothetical protein